MAVLGNNTADANVYSHTIMSALDSDALMPEVAEKLYRPFGDEWRTYLRLNMLGFNTMTGNVEYSHHEKDKAYTSVVVGSISPVTGNEQEVVITGTAGTDPLFIREKDLIMWADISADPDKPHAIRLVVKTVVKSTRTVTLRPQDSNDIMPALAAGDVLVIYSGVSGEGSDSVDPAFSRTRKYSNNLQIIDEKVTTTGSAITDKLWYKIGGKNTGEGMYSEALADGEFRMLTKIDGMFWHGKAGGNQVDPTSEVDGEQKTSKGIFEAIGDYGNVNTGVTGALDDHDDIAANIIANNGSTTNPIWMGIGFGLMNNIEDNIFALYTPDQSFLEKQVNDKLWKKGNSYGSYVNFKYFQRHQFTFAYEVIMNWSNDSTYGKFADLANEGVAIPLGSTRDQVSGNTFGTVGMRYKASNSLNRKFMTSELIGFGSNKPGEQIVSSVDTRSALWKADVGNQFMEVANMTHLMV
jgi:hypothetical protein